MSRSAFFKTCMIIGIAAAFTGCNIPMRFNTQGWTTPEDPVFPPPCRKLMLDDLLVNHQLKGLHYRQLIDTLGTPDVQEPDTLTYFIIVDYGSDIDPVDGKNLYVYFNKDSIVTGYQVQ